MADKHIEINEIHESFIQRGFSIIATQVTNIQVGGYVGVRARDLSDIVQLFAWVRLA